MQGSGYHHIHGTPALWKNANGVTTVYVWPERDYLRAYTWDKVNNVFDCLSGSGLVPCQGPAGDAQPVQISTIENPDCSFGTLGCSKESRAASCRSRPTAVAAGAQSSGPRSPSTPMRSIASFPACCVRLTRRICNKKFGTVKCTLAAMGISTSRNSRRRSSPTVACTWRRSPTPLMYTASVPHRRLVRWRQLDRREGARPRRTVGAGPGWERWPSG